MPAVQETIDQVRQIDVDQYKYGFETVIESLEKFLAFLCRADDTSLPSTTPQPPE